MQQTGSAGGVFVLDGHTTGDCSDFAVARPIRKFSGAQSSRGMLLVVAEPLDRAPGDSCTAAAVTALVCDSFPQTTSADLIDQLCQKFSDANDLVLAANRKRGLSRPLYLGLTVVVAYRRSLIVAQTPPAQVILRDRRGLSCWPSLSSWSTGTLKDAAVPLDGFPLGLTKELCPRIITRQLPDRYEVVAISSSVATALATTGSHELLRNRYPLEHHIIRCGSHCSACPGYGVGATV